MRDNLNHWLGRIQKLNPTLAQLEAIIRDGRRTSHVVKEQLEGSGSIHKARLLYNRWNNVSSTVEKEATKPQMLIPDGQKLNISGAVYTAVYDSSRDGYNLKESLSWYMGRSDMEKYVKNYTYLLIDPNEYQRKIVPPFDNVVMKSDILKGMSSNGTSIVFPVKQRGNSYGVNMTLTLSPTHNCQLSVLGNMNSLSLISSNLKAQVLEISKATGKALLLCDVNSTYSKRIVDALGKGVISNQPYKSSNGSSMVILIINSRLL